MLSDEEDVDDVEDDEEDEDDEDAEGLSTEGTEVLDGEEYIQAGNGGNQLGGGEEEDLFRSLLARAGFHLSYGDSPPLLLDPSQLQVG